MSDRVDDLQEVAMQPSEADRGEIAARRFEGLGPDDGGPRDAEIARRLREIDAGDVRPIPWDEARRMILENDGPGSG